MSMNGIDISNWQNGINLDAVPYDFIIAKATQGKTYVSTDCARQVEQARARGKLFGVYHYIDGSGAIGEADFFIDNIKNWVGEGVLCLDWESNQNSAWGNEDYLRQVAQRVIDRTGIPPIIYVQQSRMAKVKPIADALNCALWIAQYANMNATGYQDAPWNEGTYSCAIRQYSSCGRLSGYSGNLDLNKAYMDAAVWKKYANPGGSTSTPAPSPSQPADSAPSGSTLDLVYHIVTNDINGDARRDYWAPPALPAPPAATTMFRASSTTHTTPPRPRSPSGSGPGSTGTTRCARPSSRPAAASTGRRRTSSTARASRPPTS